MKNRSHRLSISEAHEDWVDGSWTVDCVCGVNYDDGEEMVNCDECGVWVHTRCSRYVKSEKSFACEKCKIKKNGTGGVGNDSEETEVAEFLVELPTKTLRMSNPNPASVSSRKPARLWTDIPMEERVHVQGVPGGDPGLFSGINLLSVFGPELWKATGYVPKKFNFQYSEFPHSSDGEVEEKKEDFIKKRSEGDAPQVGFNSGAFFPLSMEGEITLPTPMVDTVGVKSPEGGGCYERSVPRQRKRSDYENQDFMCSDGNERSSMQPILLHCGKRKKDISGTSKDQSAKKKARSNDRGGDLKKRVAYDSKQDGGSNAVNNDIECGRDVLGDQQSDGLGECGTNLTSNVPGLDASLENDVSSDGISKKGNKEDQVLVRSVSLSDSGNEGTELNGPGSTSVKEEGQDIHSCLGIGGGTGVGISSCNKESLVVDATVAGPNAKESKNGPDSNIEEASSSPNKKLKVEVDVDFGSLPLDCVKLNTAKPASQHSESTDYVFSENCKVVVSSGSEAGDHKAHAGNKNPNVAITKIDQSDDSPCTLFQSKREPTGSEGSVGARKRSSELPHTSEVAKEMLKSSNAVTTHSTSYQRKVVVSVGKSSISASALSKFSDNHISPTAQNHAIDSKKKDLSESTAETKENSANDLVEDVGKCGRPKKFVKEPSRLNSPSETSQSTKLSHTSDSKKISSDSKEFTTHSSSKVPSVSKVKAASGSGECDYPPQADGASNLQSKAAGSVVPSKADKFYHSGSHQSSRGNLASMAAPSCSNVPAALSDEELAFLLHQELNSSPRVPRVPRMRHPGSLPQLASPTATSMLMKRTSSIGGKDHGMSSRRKIKEFPRDGSHRTQERDNEAKKLDQKPSSPDSRRRDTGCSLDRLSRREINGGSVKGVQSMKMRKVSSSLSSSSDANGCNVSSSHPSSRNSSDDDPRMLGRSTNRTLPGLIAEIMSEGKRMTYEELCNAVLPHWPHLRKHNGERYAYSSHSQAVLDCLRNRTEWARLVDRGPKTSGSRKRRKLDTDSVSVDSEDNEDLRGKDAGSKSFESQQEEFPKGKRKARTRGRLTLPGRGIVRRRRRAEVVSDDESESYSNSSEDSMSSEEEIQGGGTSIAGNEASASSEEAQ